MSQANTIQTNFTSGELSPLLRGRTDITRYFNGAEKIENFIVKPQGGLYRRSGTRFVGEVKDSSRKVLLQQFQFSRIQAYIVEFGHLYIRFYMDGGVIEDPPGTPVEVVSPYSEDDLEFLNFTQSADVMYCVHPDYPPYKLSRTSHVDWTFEVFETKDGPYLPENDTDISLAIDPATITNTGTITAPSAIFVAGDVDKYVEYDDDGNKKPAKITAVVSSTVATVIPYQNVLAEIDKTAKFTAGPTSGTGTLTSDKSIFSRANIDHYIRYRVGDVGVSSAYYWGGISAFKDSVNVTVVAVTQVSAAPSPMILTNHLMTATVKAYGGDVFEASDVGRMIRMNFSSEVTWCVITSFVSATQVVVELKRYPPRDDKNGQEWRDNLTTKRWKLGAWSERTGYPSCVTFHDERLVFAASVNEPQTIWMSKSADFNNFSPTETDSIVADDSGITVTIASSDVNSIVWLSSSAVLLAGTIGGEWQIKSSSLTEPITPTNISAQLQTTSGSSAGLAKPRKVGSALIFLQRSGSRLRELQYSFEIDAFVAKDLTIVSDHILREGGRGTDVDYQQEPNSIIWVVRNDGQLAGFTHVRDQEVYAWHRHIIAGSFGDDPAVVENIEVIPSLDGSFDVLYLVVKRTINGVTKRYIEYMEYEFDPQAGDTKNGMFFMDCGLSYSGTPVITISNLDHLEGETVAVLADGAVIPNKIVKSGEIILDYAASNIHVGLPYRSMVKTLPPEGGGQFGTAQGKTKRTHRMVVRLLNSLGFKYGTSLDKLVDVSFRATNDPMDASPELFTGDKAFNLAQGYNTDDSYFFVQDNPYPLTIIAIMPEMYVND